MKTPEWLDTFLDDLYDVPKPLLVVAGLIAVVVILLG